jgi:hypothetical protein
MKIAKVRISKPVLAEFFIKNNRAFAVETGLPMDAELISFKYETKTGHYIATFKSDKLKDIENGASIPFINVTYCAYIMQPKEETVEGTPESETVQ